MEPDLTLRLRAYLTEAGSLERRLKSNPSRSPRQLRRRVRLAHLHERLIPWTQSELYSSARNGTGGLWDQS